MGSDPNKISMPPNNKGEEKCYKREKKMRSDWHRNFLSAAPHTLNAWLNIFMKILQIMMFAGLTTYLWIGEKKMGGGGGWYPFRHFIPVRSLPNLHSFF